MQMPLESIYSQSHIHKQGAMKAGKMNKEHCRRAKRNMRERKWKERRAGDGVKRGSKNERKTNMQKHTKKNALDCYPCIQLRIKCEYHRYFSTSPLLHSFFFSITLSLVTFHHIHRLRCRRCAHFTLIYSKAKKREETKNVNTPKNESIVWICASLRSFNFTSAPSFSLFLFWTFLIFLLFFGLFCASEVSKYI